MRQSFEPKAYQQPAIDFLKRTPRCALHGGIGSGKTVIALTAIEELYLELGIWRALFVAPLNVILNTLPDEIDTWEHLADMSYSVLHGPQKDDRLKDNSQVHLINYEGLEWLLRSPDRPFYDMVVFDECHWIKDRRTKRFRMLARMLPHVPRIIMMSGTPIGNSLADLWSQYYLLDRGDRLMRSYDSFMRHYFYQADYLGYEWKPYDWAEVAIIERIEDITFQIHPDDVELTSLFEAPVYCDLPSSVMEQYRTFEREFFLQYEEAEIEAFNAVSLSTKLRQLANGFLYYGDTNVHRRSCKRFHDTKWDMLQSFVSHARQNIMVVCTFQEDFEAFLRFFPDAPCAYGKTTPTHNRKVFKAWNDKELPLFAIHPRSVGTGLNLQAGGHRQIWMSPDWSYLAKNQTVGRLHRTGQTEDVQVEVITAKDTIDELILESVHEKTVSIKSFAAKLKLYRRMKLGAA